MDHSTIVESPASSDSRENSCSESKSHNPYQRLPSRRPISCVTCAKAKTKCDKALPSCSRCITKGIKCDPRSTRRTSDNSYRASIKKPSASPKRYCSTSKIPSLSQNTSPGAVGLAMRRHSIHAASHLDFLDTAKANHEASICAGFPTLTPLPTYTSQTFESCRAYPLSPDANLPDMTYLVEANTFPVTGCLAPQTPESLVHLGNPLIREFPEHWNASQIWTEDTSGQSGLEFDPNKMTSMLPMQLWSTSDLTHEPLVTDMDWHQASLSASSHAISYNLVLHATAVPSLSLSEHSPEVFTGGSNLLDTWASCQALTAQLEMVNMASPTHFEQGPAWGDLSFPAQRSVSWA